MSSRPQRNYTHERRNLHTLSTHFRKWLISLLFVKGALARLKDPENAWRLPACPSTSSGPLPSRLSTSGYPPSAKRLRDHIPVIHSCHRSTVCPVVA